MTTTVGSLLTVIARHLEEDAQFSTGLWTTFEMIQYLADADREFLSQSGTKIAVAAVSSVVGQGVYQEPRDCIDMERVAWSGVKMYPQSRFNMDRQNSNWKSDVGTPKRYHRDQLPPKQFEVWPAPTVSGLGYGISGRYGTVRSVSGASSVGTYGVLRQASGARNYYIGSSGRRGTLRQVASGDSNFLVFYDILPIPVAAPSDTVSTPDAFTRYLIYKALEKAWSKEGDGQDVLRSAFCRVRFSQGVSLARRLLHGAEPSSK